MDIKDTEEYKSTRVLLNKLTMKQETLEEAVNKYFKLSHLRLINEQQKEYERELFIAGAEYMQKKMYSEEEVKHIISETLQSVLVTVDLDQWLKQFKKK